MATPPSTWRSPRQSNGTVRRHVCFRRLKGISATSLSRQPLPCNSGVQPPPRGRGGPAKPRHTPPHLPAPFVDPLLRAQAHHDERRRPGRHTSPHPPPRAPPGRRTQTFSGTFIFGGRRACQSHYCRAGQRGATAARCPLLAVVSAPRRLTTPHPTSPQPPSALIDMLRQTTANDCADLPAGHTYIQQCSRTRVDTLHRWARTSAARLLSNAAVPLPSNAPVPFPSNATISAQSTSVLVRAGQPQTRNAQQQRLGIVRRRARTSAVPVPSNPAVPLLSNPPESHSSRTAPCDSPRTAPSLSLRTPPFTHNSPQFSSTHPTLSNPPVRLPSNPAIPFPSNAAIPVPSNAAISAQRTAVLVRATQREPQNAEQQRTLGRRARTSAAPLLSTPPVPLLSNSPPTPRSLHNAPRSSSARPSHTPATWSNSVRAP
ncbi:hypothetical protein SCP_1005690 [Sparassis crispa]|uniref:Uncharacterized protein n=1 Tax=Sparassis crispa TaxID=139825 RepID=A0A401GYT9_9APHY|nr:hypothetical protein SCP_1005690 [Sparassis crispa]GBE87321.1 hypothetical protein SCP_1005690 [Sparassis crispa]